MALINLVYLPLHIGADSGFDGICETQGACRGAVGLVKSPLVHLHPASFGGTAEAHYCIGFLYHIVPYLYEENIY